MLIETVLIGPMNGLVTQRWFQKAGAKLDLPWYTIVRGDYLFFGERGWERMLQDYRHNTAFVLMHCGYTRWFDQRGVMHCRLAAAKSHTAMGEVFPLDLTPCEQVYRYPELLVPTEDWEQPFHETAQATGGYDHWIDALQERGDPRGFAVVKGRAQLLNV